MFKPTHIITPVDARPCFAYDHSGEHCTIVGPFWREGKDVGFIYNVKLRDGTIGVVWEDEVTYLCDKETCFGCWQCDP